MLTVEAPLVRGAEWGEILAAFDGVGGAPNGNAGRGGDALIEYFDKPDQRVDTTEGLKTLIREASQRILDWGLIEDTDRPKGAAADTIVWIIDGDALFSHAGDTEAWSRSGDQCRSLLSEPENDEAIVQYFGRGRDLYLETGEIFSGGADRLLLFFDGLRKCVYHSAINHALQYTSPKEDIVRELVEQAVRVGARDDVTVMLIEFGNYSSDESTPLPPKVFETETTGRFLPELFS